MFQYQPNLIVLKIIPLAMVMWTSCGAASAQAILKFSANEVVPGCRAVITDSGISPQMTWDAAFCAGLISGLSYLSNNDCPPAGVLQVQIGRVVVQYIDARPARMHEDFRDLALEAMKAAWPCKR
jgi:hypothetical protein